MKKLTLFRHAKSSWKDASLADVDRPLKERGKKDAQKMAERLKALGDRPDAIISSHAKRARSTAKRIARVFEGKVAVSEALYEADAEAILNFAASLGDDLGEVIIVGHNPGLSVLAARLGANEELTTAAFARFEFETDSWKEIKKAAAKLLSFDYPKSDSFN